MTAIDLFAGTYRCSTCDGRYPAESMFQRNKDGCTGECGECRRHRRREWYERNTATAIAYSSAWKRRNPERWRDANRKHRYGISYGTYAELLASQSNGCAICGTVPAGKSLHVDHDHGTGRVRGLLCDLCNRGLGYFGDDAARLARAARYLESHHERA